MHPETEKLTVRIKCEFRRDIIVPRVGVGHQRFGPVGGPAYRAAGFF